MFADAFIDAFQLPYIKDPTGSFTDSYSFFDSVPECINLSVGYYNQHSKQESQDITFLEDLIDACIAMDWEALPVERDPKQDEYLTYDNYYDYTPKYDHDIREVTNGYNYALLDFIYDNPHVVADMLEEWGITLHDLQEHQQICEH